MSWAILKTFQRRFQFYFSLMQDSLLFKQFSVLFHKPHAVFKLFSECFVGQHVGDDVDIMRGNSRLQLFLVGGLVTDVEEGKFGQRLYQEYCL